MTIFAMEIEYIDPETGDLLTDTITIDDMPVLPADLFQPEPDNNSECPW